MLLGPKIKKKKNLNKHLFSPQLIFIFNNYVEFTSSKKTQKNKCECVVCFQVDTAVVPTPTHSFLCLCFLFILSFATPNCDGVRLSECFFISSAASSGSPPACPPEIPYLKTKKMFNLNVPIFKS